MKQCTGGRNKQLTQTTRSYRNSFFACFILFLLNLPLAAQQILPQPASASTPNFEHITIDQGLSQSAVRSILQDNKGFMWFGTEDGLNRYDGYEFKVFKHDPANPASLGNNFIQAMFQDDDGNIWLGTYGGGLSRFDPKTESFINFYHNSHDSSSLSNNNIRAIFRDSSGTLWIGTNGGGLNKLDASALATLEQNGSAAVHFAHYNFAADDSLSLIGNSVNVIFQDREGNLWIGTSAGLNLYQPAQSKNKPDRFIRFSFEQNNPTSLSHFAVLSIFQDRAGMLWIGTVWGLNRFDPTKPENGFTRFLQDPANPNSLNNNTIFAIKEDNDNRLWLGTVNGLTIFDVRRNHFLRLRQDPLHPGSINNNIIFSICRERAGAMWLGTYGGGLNKHDPFKNKFTHYVHNPNNPNSLNNNVVWSILEDKRDFLWIGTNAGINRFDRKNGTFSFLQNDADNPQSLSNNFVNAICEDQDEFIWFGTNFGLNRYNPNSQKFTRFQTDLNNPNSLSHNLVQVILQDRTNPNILWISTDFGLNRFDVQKNSFTHFFHDATNPRSISQNQTCALFQDSNGALWVGTRTNGLNRFDAEMNEFTRYLHDPTDPSSLSNNGVLCIYEDTQKTMWVGTNAGLNRFYRTNGIFTHYWEKDGLPNDMIYGILEDNQGFLWLSTNAGLSRFDRQNELFKNYTRGDGLQSNEFNIGAFHKSRSGELFFGGINGLNAFYPHNIKENPIAPAVQITDFRIFNKSVPISRDRNDSKSILQNSILETEEIHLSYKQNVFSFEFAALNFTNPQKNMYQYKMEGFDEDWLHTDATNRLATYTNLDPGDYVFRVKGANDDGVWNESGASVILTISPPFWKTLWFRALVGLAILCTAFIWYRSRIRKIEVKRKELENRVKEKTAAAQKLQNALEEVKRLKNRLQDENTYLQSEIRIVHNFENIITRSESLKKILRSVEQVASTDATVLILGETGTGKELLARAVHNISSRGKRPLVKVNCSALPANLIESELFGHEKGAFTGAIARKVGRFELANGGTIFLDEIGDVPLELQVKLLRVLQEGEFERLGSSETHKVDVRIIAATNRDLHMEIAQGRFREDLFYRLNVFPIVIPPLRERKEDISLLINYFVKKFSRKIGKPIKNIPQSLVDKLCAYDWPGNVRELENIVERAVIVSPGAKLVCGDWLPKDNGINGNSKLSTLEENERSHIIKALEKTGWRISGEKGAAKLLQINPKTLESRMKKLGIERNA